MDRLMCMAQTDLKRLIAYSSVAHLGFVMLGLAALTPEAASARVLQMVNHGISTGALFLMIGLLYERTHTRELSAYGGLAKVTPALARPSWSSRSRASACRAPTASSASSSS